MSLYFALIDESGTPDPPKKNGEVFVLASLMLHESELISVQHELDNIARKHNLGGTEIHATDLINRKGEFTRIPESEMLKLLDDLVELIREIKCNVIAVVLYKNVASIKPKEYRQNALSCIVELLAERLAWWIHWTNNKEEREELLILTMDMSIPKREVRTRELLREAIKKGIYLKNIPGRRYIIPSIMFVDSKEFTPIQLVDLIAYFIYQKHSNRGYKISQFDYLYSVVKSKIYKGPQDNQISCGLKVWDYIGT